MAQSLWASISHFHQLCDLHRPQPSLVSIFLATSFNQLTFYWYQHTNSQKGRQIYSLWDSPAPPNSRHLRSPFQAPVATMNSPPDRAALLDPSGENMFDVDQNLWLEHQRLNSVLRKTSIFAGGGVSNATPVRVNTSQQFHLFPILPNE
jgi:hypothetical protein